MLFRSENFYEIDENILVVKEGDQLDLGNLKLTFYMTPMVHWPESMVSFEETSGTLFSQDAFGGFGALNGAIFDDQINWEFYADETARYFSNIIGKFSKMVQNALKKLSKLDIKMVCSVHGPVWRENPNFILDLYDKLSSYQTEEGVVIAYGSMYGNTAQMADYVANQLAKEGIKNIKVYDVSKTHHSYILTDIWKYKAVVLGSCTYNNSLFPNMAHLVDLLKENNIENHILGVFGSYSWSGGALTKLKEFGENSKFDMIEKTVETKSSPKEEDFKALKEFSIELANKIKETRTN